jgi:hypothetical protein
LQQLQKHHNKISVNTLELINTVILRLKRNFLWLVLGAGIGGSLMGIIGKENPKIYAAYSKIFPLVQDGASDPLSSFKSQLGLDNGSGGDVAKYYNVAELVKSKNLSRKIVVNAISEENPTPIYKALIEDYNKSINKYFVNPIKLSKDSIENINLGAELFTGKVDIKKEKTEFTTITTTTCDPELALVLNKNILSTLSEFYVNSRTEKSRVDLKRIGLLKDSLFIALDNIERSLAEFEGTSRYSVDETVQLPVVKLQRLREEIVEQYQGTATAYQNAKFKLMSESPIFQVLDEPTGPVKMTQQSWKKGAITGAIIGAILMALLVLSKLIMQIAVKSLSEEN